MTDAPADFDARPADTFSSERRLAIVRLVDAQGRVRVGALSDAVLAWVFAREMQARLQALKSAVENKGVLQQSPVQSQESPQSKTSSGD